MPQRLDRAFFRRDAVTLARALLGQRLVRVIGGERLAGVIVETEAYLGPEDRAAHSFGGRRTARNASMYLDAGHAYVYFIYGVHYCVNVTAETEGNPAAVLLRALEPVEGIDRMRERRGDAARKDAQLCSGPGKLCQALGIDRALDGADLTASADLWIEEDRRRPLPASRVVTTTRVGVGYAGEWAQRPLRFYVKDNPHVSRK